MLLKLKKDLNNLGNKKKKEILQRFFKTGKGQYGEGDIFLGITVPEQRTIAKKYSNLSFKDLQSLLNTKIHEYRLTALLILCEQYSKSDEKSKKQIYNFYLKNTRNINNWDLVDLSGHKILGAHLFDKDKNILYKLAKSKDLWERRISMLSTYYFIRNNQFTDSFKIAEILLNDKHDLIHKVVGWMLREIGKIDQPAEEKFLKKHYKTMPRTMLRYSIEKFEESKRKKYLKGQI
ncbi:MAG: DNA alkylation repair protein [Nanoarchaeota archaeon]|nr:DNA alkylation repair protein [Nanoarchaeota archaeon]